MLQTVQPIPKGKKFFRHKKKYKGVPHKQADNVFEIFDRFFEQQTFDVIIELGSGTGGFSLYLAEKLGKKFHTFDLVNKMDIYSDVKTRIKKLGSSIYFEDVFKSSTLKTLLNSKERILLLCDNGDKLKELTVFASYLKKNDVIMSHDYFPTVVDYENQNTWKCCAITDKDENDSTLETYCQDDFNSCFWMCRKKQ